MQPSISITCFSCASCAFLRLSSAESRFNVTAAAATLPPSLKSAWLAWQPVEGREARLGRLTAGIAADFRAATGVDADPDFAEKPSAVPLRCVRHC